MNDLQRKPGASKPGAVETSRPRRSLTRRGPHPFAPQVDASGGIGRSAAVSVGDVSAASGGRASGDPPSFAPPAPPAPPRPPLPPEPLALPPAPDPPPAPVPVVVVLGPVVVTGPVTGPGPPLVLTPTFPPTPPVLLEL